MTQEEKELLFKDLCARLPYHVICTGSRHGDSSITEIDVVEKTVYCYDFDEYVELDKCKPYLRPMSSMTEDECKKLGELPATIENISEILPNTPYFIEVVRPEQIDWFNKRMIDYRGLIEKGLALEAPEGMYEY